MSLIKSIKTLSESNFYFPLAANQYFGRFVKKLIDRL